MSADTTEARLARAEQAIDLLLRVLHVHAESHGDPCVPSFNAYQLTLEWNDTMENRFSDALHFKPLELPL